MNPLLSPQIAAEIEFGLESPQGDQLYQLSYNGKLVLASNAVLDMAVKLGVRSQVPTLKPELDACQIEICSHGPKDNNEDVVDEIIHFHSIVLKIIEALSHECQTEIILKTTAMPSNFDFVPLLSDAQPHYGHIHDVLMQAGGNDLRKCTNIKGVHIHRGVENKQAGVYLLNALEKRDIKKRFERFITPERISCIERIVRALGEHCDHKIIKDPQAYMVQNAHTHTRYTKHTTVEIRFPDLGVEQVESEENLYQKLFDILLHTQVCIEEALDMYPTFESTLE